MKNNLTLLSTRSGVNIAYRHFNFIKKAMADFENGKNLADIVNDAIENKQITQEQIPVIVNSMLVDKYGYYFESMNLSKLYSGSLSDISNEISTWNKLDIVLSYYHPQLGLVLINPKNEESINSVGQLKENELIVFYIGYFNKEFDIELAKKCAKAIKSILNNEKVTNTKIFKLPQEEKVVSNVSEIKQEVKKQEQVVKTKEQIKPTETKEQPKDVGTQKVETQKTAPSSTKKRMSPHYGVLVSNELFHNGNVEAWKKIIASYEAKYPDTKVLVFYEGEQIHDINTLFKWGKVKHGTNIYFALLGVEFRDVSKLRRYLTQGASNRFEDFLKGDPTKVLALF